jgi:hypothetical protein
MTRLPFLHADNAATLALLRERSTQMSANLIDRIAHVGNESNFVDNSDDNSDEESALMINKQLRGLLVEVIESLPDTPTGMDARRQIATHLKHRIANDPALQRRK